MCSSGPASTAIALIMDRVSSSMPMTAVTELARLARSRSTCDRNNAITTPARPVKIAPSAVSRATHRASGVGLGQFCLSRVKSITPPLTNETVQSSGWKKTGWVESWQCQYELKPSTALVATRPATTTTGTLPDRRARWERKLDTHSATITVTTIAIVVDDPGSPNHLNQFGSQLDGGGTRRQNAQPPEEYQSNSEQRDLQRAGRSGRALHSTFLPARDAVKMMASKLIARVEMRGRATRGAATRRWCG